MTREFISLLEEIDGAEGPVVDREGRFFMVHPNAGEVLEVISEKRTRVHANTGGVPAGLQVDRENHLWAADMKLGILRISPDGNVERVVDRFGDGPIRGCNDCYFDSQGNLYFTAPADSNQTTPIGELFCRAADGNVHKLDEGFAFCNGLVVTADDAMLIVAETFTKTLWAYDIEPPGQVGNKRVFATLLGEHTGGPDGLELDAAGNLIATNWGGGCLEVFSSEGRRLELVRLPFAKPSNLHFGGEGFQWLYITEHTYHGLWKTRWPRPGQPQYAQGPITVQEDTEPAGQP